MRVESYINNFSTQLNNPINKSQTDITREEDIKNVLVDKYQERADKNSLQYFIKSLTGLDVKLNMTTLDATRAYVIEHTKQEAQKAYA